MMNIRTILFTVLCMQALAIAAHAATNTHLDVTVTGIDNNKPIVPQFAFCTADGQGAVMAGGNISPAISWSIAPEETKSYAILVIDPDVPANFDPANKAGKTIADSAPRRNFYHWVLADVPATTTHIEENTQPIGVAGKNDFGTSAKGMAGYDGPCPPWNDERLHHYHFHVYALDIASLNLKTPFGGKQVEDAIRGHVLAQGEVVGTYTTNTANTKK